MYRDAERQLKSALRDQDVVDTYLYLCKVYRRLDQPMTAVEVYKKVCLCVLCLPSLSLHPCHSAELCLSILRSIFSLVSIVLLRCALSDR